MGHAVKVAEDENREAEKRLEKASSIFLKAQDAQAKADASAKSAADTEAQLTDSKADALRGMTAAQEMTAAAAKATMNSIVDSSANASALKRDTHIAEEAVLKAEHSLTIVQEKLAAAEKATKKLQENAAQAAQTTVDAHHELEVAKTSAVQTATRKELLEEQVSKKAEQLAHLAEAFTEADKAKTEALGDYAMATKSLASSIHKAAIFRNEQAPASSGLSRIGHGEKRRAA